MNVSAWIYTLAIVSGRPRPQDAREPGDIMNLYQDVLITAFLLSQRSDTGVRRPNASSKLKFRGDRGIRNGREAGINPEFYIVSRPA
jgi:hypothetical protein